MADPMMPTGETTYSREMIVASLEGILDRANHGAFVYDAPGDEDYWNGYRDAIKGLLVNFGERGFDVGLSGHIPAMTFRFKGKSILRQLKGAVFVGLVAVVIGAILMAMGLSRDSSVVATLVMYWGVLRFWK